MKQIIVLDSSVFVAAIRQDESKHKECKRLLQMIHEGKYLAIEPYTLLVKFVAAVRGIGFNFINRREIVLKFKDKKLKKRV